MAGNDRGAHRVFQARREDAVESIVDFIGKTCDLAVWCKALRDKGLT